LLWPRHANLTSSRQSPDSTILSYCCRLVPRMIAFLPVSIACSHFFSSAVNRAMSQLLIRTPLPDLDLALMGSLYLSFVPAPVLWFFPEDFFLSAFYGPRGWCSTSSDVRLGSMSVLGYLISIRLPPCRNKSIAAASNTPAAFPLDIFLILPISCWSFFLPSVVPWSVFVTWYPLPYLLALSSSKAFRLPCWRVCF